MMMDEKLCAKELMDFIHVTTSPYHAARRNDQDVLLSVHAPMGSGIAAGQTVHFPLFDTGAVIISIGEDPKGPLRMVCAHTDFPCLRIKPNPVITEHGYGKLNVEVYGGMIRNTWMDRPLSIAGAVAMRTEDPFSPSIRLVDFRRPLMIIPNLAIHMNRKVNEGIELKPQKDLLPLFFLTDGMGARADDEGILLDLLADELDVLAEDILSYALNVYPVEEGCLLGVHEEIISAPRLDNLSSVKACLDVIHGWKGRHGIRVAALFDNEEVGSRTKQGAASAILSMILERVYAALGFSRDEYLQAVCSGFCLSADVAHGLHPNAPEKADPTNRPRIGDGVVLKVAANQSYAGDPQSFAVIRALCEQEKIPYQVFTNHSDAVGGATLGSIFSTVIPMRTMDIGVPILGMHSSRETMGRCDQFALTRLMHSFFSC